MTSNVLDTELEQFLRDDPGHPLGRGMPTGRPLGTEGSHGQRWMRLLRLEPCAYCARPGAGGTVDHVDPQCRRNRTTHTWANYVGACERCNWAKGNRPLLVFLLRRRGG